MSEPIKINLLNNGEFQSVDTSSKTVGDLRNEMEIPTSARINVGGTIRQNDFELTDNCYVAWATDNKTGG
jgi:uncharacterized protein YabE (DUF348 family)